MKVRASVRRICEKCKLIRRKGVVRIIAKTPATSSDKVKTCPVFKRRYSADKPTHVSLRYIRGLGPSTSLEVCEKLHITHSAGPRNSRTTKSPASPRCSTAITWSRVRFRRQEASNIARLKEIKAYRGERHRKNLPCRGQRTKTNARSRKGVRKTVAGKKGVKDK